MLDEVMIEFAKSLKKEASVVESKPSDIELLPNTFAELEISQPLYQEGLFLAAADENVDILHEKKFPHEPEDMIERAHPKSIFVSPALGDGGLVENQNEQHAKILQIVNKRPTGNQIHLYASIIEDLVKVANVFDEHGHDRISKAVDDVLADLTDSKKKIVKEAFGPLVIPLVVGILSVIGVGGAAATYTGIPDDLVEDSKDALAVAQSLPSEFPNNVEAAREIVEDVRVIATLSQELSRMTSQGKLTVEQARRYENTMGSLEAAYRQVNQKISFLKSRERSLVYLPRVEWHLKVAYAKLAELKKGLESVGLAVQRNRQSLPGETELAQHRDQSQSAPAAQPVSLTAVQKTAVQGFLEELRPGVTDRNYDQRLGEFADAVIAAIHKRTGVRIDNLSAARLKNADVNKLKKLLTLAKEPLISIQYKPDDWEPLEK
jgi:hypothetical protein